MKKIILLGLFLSIFLIFPKETFATACCSGIYTYVDYSSSDPKLVGCCNTNLGDCTTSTLHYDSNQYRCGINACDKGSQQCTTTAQTKDPACPPGTNNNLGSMGGCTNEQKANYCCQDGGLGFCKAKPNTPPLALLTCNDVYLVFKNYCGSDGLWKYNPTILKCEQLAASPWDLKKTTCKDMSTNQDIVGFATAIGCVPTGDLQAFLKFVLVYAFVASGGIILLLIISTGYTIITSSGNPEKLQGAQENIVALFSGLALIAFSLVLLQAIGADILNLKAFIP